MVAITSTIISVEAEVVNINKTSTTQAKEEISINNQLVMVLVQQITKQCYADTLSKVSK